MARLPWFQVYHRGGSSESPDPHHCPQFPHLSIWELDCVICKVSASSSGPLPLVLYPLGTFPLTPIVVCNTDEDICDSSYFWITLGLAVTTVGWLTLLLSFWRYLADVFKPWNFRAHNAILLNSFLVCFCGNEAFFASSSLFQRKLNSLVLCLWPLLFWPFGSLLRSCHLVWGLKGHTQVLTHMDSSLEQERAEFGRTTSLNGPTNRRLGTSLEIRLFWVEQNTCFPGPTGFPRG